MRNQFESVKAHGGNHLDRPRSKNEPWPPEKLKNCALGDVRQGSPGIGDDLPRVEGRQSALAFEDAATHDHAFR